MKMRILAGVVSVLLLAAMLGGCGKGKGKIETIPEPEIENTEGAQKTPETEPTELLTPEVTEPEETEPEETEPEETVPDNCILVSTPYGNLLYQEQWTEFMRTEQVNEGDNLVVAFYTEINDVRYVLFELEIGSRDGSPAGKLTAEDGIVRDVFVRMVELEDTDLLSETERNRLFAMQEDVNFIIENLK